MTGLTPCLAPIPGPLVETGAVVARECEVEIAVGAVFVEGEGDGDGEGEGETTGEGEGEINANGDGAAVVTVPGFWVAAEVFCAYRLTP